MPIPNPDPHTNPHTNPNPNPLALLQITGSGQTTSKPKCLRQKKLRFFYYFPSQGGEFGENSG